MECSGVRYGGKFVQTFFEDSSIRQSLLLGSTREKYSHVLHYDALIRIVRRSAWFDFVEATLNEMYTSIHASEARISRLFFKKDTTF
jgi:hypothetical protein